MGAEQLMGATVEQQNVWVLDGRRFPLATGLRAVCRDHDPEEPFIPAWQASDVHLDEEPGAWVAAALDAAEHNALQHADG